MILDPGFHSSSCGATSLPGWSLPAVSAVFIWTALYLVWSRLIFALLRYWVLPAILSSATTCLLPTRFTNILPSLHPLRQPQNPHIILFLLVFLWHPSWRAFNFHTSISICWSLIIVSADNTSVGSKRGRDSKVMVRRYDAILRWPPPLITPSRHPWTRGRG